MLGGTALSSALPAAYALPGEVNGADVSSRANAWRGPRRASAIKMEVCLQNTACPLLVPAAACLAHAGARLQLEVLLQCCNNLQVLLQCG